MSKAKWTFMVYLAGDNNLEGFGVKDMREMKAVGSSEDLSIVAQFDSMSDDVARRYYLTAGQGLATDCVAELPEVNTGDPNALTDFIAWASGNYPADRYALVLWNHGSGWKDEDIYHTAEQKGIADKISRGQVRGLSSGKPSRALFATTLEKMVVEATERAILFDDSSADFLDSQELKRVLQTAIPEGVKSFDLLGFDACLMNMLEVHYQVRGTCQVVVGSQEVEPGDGWPYDAVLAQLARDPDMAPEKLGQVIVDEYVGFYRETAPHLHVTQSVVRLADIGPIAGAVGDLGVALKARLSSAQTLGILFGGLRSAQSFTDRDYIDLLHFCRLLAEGDPGGEIGNLAQRVVDLATGDSSPVIAEAHSGSDVTQATGLSIYLPARVYSPLYNDLDFAQDHQWAKFLDAFVNPH